MVVKYISSTTELKSNANEPFNKRGFLVKYIGFITGLFLIVIILLVSGLFKYYMIGISSNSMNPIYYRGDAVIIEKCEASQVKKGEILAYKYKGTIITHRVMKVENINEAYKFTTKGDNNASSDGVEVTDKDVIGKVKFVVKYIAYPTVWLNEEWS